VAEFITDLWRFSFLQYAVVTGLLASVACGIVGSYVVTRRISYIAGSIAHSVLAGLGAALYLRVVYGLTWLQPLHGAIATALLAAVIIGLVSMRAKQREDTVIGAIWAIGMAVGILFIAKTPGYTGDLMSYLFGNILMVSSTDLWLILALDAGVVGVALLFYNKLQAVCFDEEFARLRGVRVELYYLLLLCLTALTVVLLVSVVGIVMVIALLTLPAAVAGYFSRSLRQMMLLSTVFSVVFTAFGLAISYKPNLPSGATIIVLAGAVYLGVAAWKGRPALRRSRR
jgi:zinc transport system permease protein